MEPSVSGWTGVPRQEAAATPTFHREAVGPAKQDVEKKTPRIGSVVLG